MLVERAVAEYEWRRGEETAAAGVLGAEAAARAPGVAGD